MDQSSPATRVATPVLKEEPKSSEKVSDSPLAVLAELPPEDTVLAKASTARKITLLALFSAAQFLDAFNNRSVHPLILQPLISLTLYTLYPARYFLRSPTFPKGSRLLLRRPHG